MQLKTIAPKNINATYKPLKTCQNMSIDRVCPPVELQLPLHLATP